MFPVMLKSRAGFTLVEVLIALTMTAVIGAAVTGAFISQSRFFDTQERVGAARNISRAAINVMTSELRMVDMSFGVVAATNSSVTLRVPYAMGLYCSSPAGTMYVSRLPADSVMLASAKYSGYAYRNGATYVPVPMLGTLTPTQVGTPTECNTAGVTIVNPGTPAGGAQWNVPLGTAGLATGTPIFFYQTITYSFAASTAVPGRIGLYRDAVNDMVPAEELLAPFDTTAKFRFYVNDSPTAQTAAPGMLNTINGLEITLDGLSERPSPDGTFQSVPLSTSVFFRNR